MSVSVSFIIPAYNASKTIKRCLDSIINLQLDQSTYEIIAIDDCSKDNTLDVLNTYASELSNLTILTQRENHRQGAARNMGFSVAKGDYICFVDSDDCIAKGVVTAIKMMESRCLDIVAMKHAYFAQNGSVISIKELPEINCNTVFTGIELQNRNPYWCTAPWGYLYSSSFMRKEGICFAENVLYEDSDFVMTTLYRAKRVSYVPECCYNMFYNSESTTHSMSYKNCSDYFLLGTRMLQLHSIIIQDTESVTVDNNGVISSFADSILEGACYNIFQSFRRLYKLWSFREIYNAFKRIDQYVDRRSLYDDDRLRRYYWTGWTSVCLRIHLPFACSKNLHR